MNLVLIFVLLFTALTLVSSKSMKQLRLVYKNPMLPKLYLSIYIYTVYI